MMNIRRGQKSKMTKWQCFRCGQVMNYIEVSDHLNEHELEEQVMSYESFYEENKQ